MHPIGLQMWCKVDYRVRVLSHQCLTLNCQANQSSMVAVNQPFHAKVTLNEPAATRNTSPVAIVLEASSGV